MVVATAYGNVSGQCTGCCSDQMGGKRQQSEAANPVTVVTVVWLQCILIQIRILDYPSTNLAAQICM